MFDLEYKIEHYCKLEEEIHIQLENDDITPDKYEELLQELDNIQECRHMIEEELSDICDYEREFYEYQ